MSHSRAENNGDDHLNGPTVLHAVYYLFCCRHDGNQKEGQQSLINTMQYFSPLPVRS